MTMEVRKDYLPVRREEFGRRRNETPWSELELWDGDNEYGAHRRDFHREEDENCRDDEPMAVEHDIY